MSSVGPSRDPLHSPVVEVLAALDARALSAEELMRATLGRIEATRHRDDGVLQVTRAFDRATGCFADWPAC